MKKRFSEWVKVIKGSDSSIHSIESFIRRNRSYVLLLLILFFLASRALSLLAVIVSKDQQTAVVFVQKIVFHTILAISLILAFFIVNTMERLSISIVLVNLIATLIFALMNAPEDPVIALFSFFTQMIFFLMVFHLLFHDNKISLMIFSATIAFMMIYYLQVGDLLAHKQEAFFGRFFIIIVLYGLTLITSFTIAINMEYHSFIKFIKNLLYADFKLGLPNEKCLERDFSAIENDDIPYNVIAVYITNLLALNRQSGYENIQRELRNRLKRIQETVKEHSNLYKWDGPVFIFYCKETDESLQDIIDEIVAIMNEVTRYREGTISFKTSFFATVYPNDGNHINMILENLRLLKYSNFRGTSPNEKLYWFSPLLQEKSQRSIRLEKDIHNAVMNDEIEIMIQPKVDIQTEKPIGGEVLARWNHPEYGWVPPLEFIPLIEMEGLMDAFTELIFRNTETVLQRMNGLVSMDLAVNISASSLVSGYINQVLINDRPHGSLNPLDGLELELTEDILFELNEHSKGYISALKHAGYKICIDDFGTGFSNFEYLQQLEIDILKIDKRFIDRMLQNEKSLVVIDAIIKMAHTLGVSVVAEGVEYQEQLVKLRELECDCVQGYYYSKPLLPADFLEYIN